MMSNNVYRNERGATLVEVIASFVILVILLVSFFTFFIQTKQTTKNSEEIVDATYIAQTEMEKIYKFSKNTGLSQEIITQNLGFQPEALNANNSKNFKKTISNSQIIILKLADNKNIDGTINNNLMNVIIEIKKESVIKAKMETVVKWKGN